MLVKSRPRITPENIDERSQALDISFSQKKHTEEICENMKNLVLKQFISPDFLHIIDLSNRQKYREFLERRNTFLEKHQLMNASEFARLFGNEQLKNKIIADDKELISGKYNKSDINQGKLGLCTFMSFLKILKETPFFETLIRCSLQRNETGTGWKCLLPFCNNEGKYVEILDEEIIYLKNNKIGSKELISDSSLGFNILETIFVKIYGPEDSPIGPQIGKKTYENFMEISLQDLNSSIPGAFICSNLNAFLGNDKFKFTMINQNNPKELKSLIDLMKSGIIKMSLNENKFYTSPDGKFVEVTRGDFKGLKYENIVKKEDIKEGANLNVINGRGYSIDLIHEAGPDEEISIGRSPQLGLCFMIKGTDEWFVPGHEYSIEGMYKNGDEIFVTIINPRYTQKKINIPLKYMDLFSNVGIIGFDIDKFFVENEENNEVK